MSQNLLKVLKANQLMRSPDEVAAFEQALAELAYNPNPTDLPDLHLRLDDNCQQPEVMFSLVHFLESFDMQEQFQAFIEVMPGMVERATGWTAIIYSRIINDATAQKTFEEILQLMDVQKRDEIEQLLSSVLAKQSSKQMTKVA